MRPIFKFWIDLFHTGGSQALRFFVFGVTSIGENSLMTVSTTFIRACT